MDDRHPRSPAPASPGTHGGDPTAGARGAGPDAPHLAPTGRPGPHPDPEAVRDAPRPRGLRLWAPKRVLVTRDARGTAVAERACRVGAALGAEIVELPGNAIRGLKGESERETYRRAKSSLAIVIAPPGKLKLQPIPPSADFRLDLATGCPAHCQYCYLAGSLPGPPITRAYANLDAVLATVPAHAGAGTVTSASAARRHEGTTFEASCYTDPLGIEHLTGGLEAAIVAFSGYARDGLDVGLRFTTKYAAVDPLLGLDHGARTRARFSVNAEEVTRRFEGGTAPLDARLDAMGRMARAGYPVGLTVAPIMPVEGWREAYAELFARAARALPEACDLTVELITHRFTPGSREVLIGWYPATSLEMDESVRTAKTNKFGGRKYVYPRSLMREMRDWFEAEVRATLPGGSVLYWT